LSDFPLIQLVPKTIEKEFTLPLAEWVFFSSANTIKFFFELKNSQREFQYACIGNATASKLAEYNIKPDFIGNSSDVVSSAVKFSKISKGKKVIFPQSDISLQTFQKHLFPKNVINLVLYNTLFEENFRQIDADVLVFTSPSNVKSYFSRFEKIKDQHIIAIGKSTAIALRENGQECTISDDPSEESIWESISHL
jgi:hydroxymethylbilane synthase